VRPCCKELCVRKYFLPLGGIEVSDERIGIFFFAGAKVVNCGQILQWRGAFRMMVLFSQGILV
jgi:hypothetical protein